MEKPDKITEVKDNVKITEVKKDKMVYSFTCPRCGGHSYNVVAASQHKFGGAGLKPTTIKVCRNCGAALEVDE